MKNSKSFWGGHITLPKPHPQWGGGHLLPTVHPLNALGVLISTPLAPCSLSGPHTFGHLLVPMFITHYYTFFLKCMNNQMLPIIDISVINSNNFLFLVIIPVLCVIKILCYRLLDVLLSKMTSGCYFYYSDPGIALMTCMSHVCLASLPSAMTQAMSACI